MKEYIEAILHRNVEITPFNGKSRLPLVYRSGYTLSRMIIADLECLLAAPLDNISLSTLRKQHKQLELQTGLRCVMYLKKTNYYSRDTMIREGIPFIWEGHQVYLPFLGILVDKNKRKELPACSRISYLTQKLLFTAMYQNWENVNVTKAAEILGVTKTSITRCFDEIETLNIPYLSIRSRARRFSVAANKKEMWEVLRPVLRNPVIKTYALKRCPDKSLPLSGISALAHYSMLDEGAYPVFAVTKKDLSKLHITEKDLSPAGKDPSCIVQEVGYMIRFANGSTVDPLTTSLSISEEDVADPRVSKAIDEMLEAHVW